MASPRRALHSHDMSLLGALLDVVLAPICLGCDGTIRAGDAARLVCRRCRTRLQAVPAPCCSRCGAPLRATGRAAGAHCPECADWPLELVRARSACTLAPPADRLVHQLKYRGWRGLAPVLAERMPALACEADARHAPQFCVPVPTSPRRLRERGYNQAELLARAYAAANGVPCVSALQRSSGQRTQTTLQPLARRANVAGAFTPAVAIAGLSGAHIALIDDVLTTGATAGECARALAAAGACCITLVTFARALDARLIHT
ncbi:MAG TPA: double zinc ribbon domain-containing protein [Longimicrobiales bacterium]|nr:double zinc ribbon domain-containing protein [Longimicrobiales bacterium]